jgi:hypothetical protein
MSKLYIGTKLIDAEPATYGEFTLKKYGENADPNRDYYKENKDKEGYIVRYENDYISWSPKEVFESFYFQLDSDKNTISQKDIDNFSELPPLTEDGGFLLQRVRYLHSPQA